MSSIPSVPSSAAASSITSPTGLVRGNASGTRIDMMLDIESFSTEPDALVLSVGAVLFDPFGEPGVMLDHIHYPLVLEQRGSTTSLDTVFWWLGQHSAADSLLKLRQEQPLISPANLHARLGYLAGRMRATKGCVWGNSPSFDCVILRRLFEREGMEGTPWKFREERCYRTLKAEFGSWVTIPKNENGHDALADAVNQAIGVQLIMGAIYNGEARPNHT